MNPGDLLEWFADTPDIADKVLEHIRLSFVPVLAALAIALPAGLYIGHARRFEFATVTVANLGRSLPSFAILALALPLSIRFGLGLGFWPTFAALFFLSLPPILVNTYIGVKGVDEDVLEAARGMGLGGGQVLLSIEVPLAAPLIVAGVRTAAVQSVATATLAALVAGGGLGEYIRLGFRANRDDFLVGGAILVALLALATELGMAAVQKAAQPKTGSPRVPSVVEPLEQVAQTGRPGDMPL
jgi:osmoprotectant transport system permease protein